MEGQETLISCIMGNVGSSVFGASSTVGTKSLDSLASAASILTLLFKDLCFSSPLTL